MCWVLKKPEILICRFFTLHFVGSSWIKCPYNEFRQHRCMTLRFLLNQSDLRTGIIHFPNVTKTGESYRPLKLAVDIKVLLFVDQGMPSLCIGPQCSVDTQLVNTVRDITDIMTLLFKLFRLLFKVALFQPTTSRTKLPTQTAEQKTSWNWNWSISETIHPSTLLTCSFGFPARNGVMQLSPLGLSQGLVYTIPYITQQVCSTYTTNTPTIRVVNDVFRNMMLALCCRLPRLAEEQGHMSASEES